MSEETTSNMEKSEPIEAKKEEEEEEEVKKEPKEEATEETTSPWKSPPLTPSNGIVQPRVVPPIGKPTRHTNQLDFLLNTVMKDAMKHKHSWPFHSPVDANKLGIPEYHKVIKKPMDLRTIEKRLKNVYYYSAKEAMEDINLVFKNCYEFNGANDDISIMCQNVENLVKLHWQNMPKEEVEAPRPTPKRGHKGRGGLKNVGSRASLSSKKSGKGELSPGDQHVIDHFHRATRAVSQPDDDQKTSSEVKKHESMSRESSVVSVQQKDADSSIDVPLTPVSTSFSSEKSGKTTKGVKRKADTTTFEDEPGKIVRRESGRPIKKPNLDYSSLEPRLKGKMTESLKFCQRLVNELLSKKYKSFAWPFYEPVDVEGLNLPDYYDIISNPMDLGTVKKKLEHRQYETAQEFAEDIRLICNNCTTYNPEGSAVHNHGKELLSVFEKKFVDCPLDDDFSEPTTVASSQVPSSLTVQTDMSEDEKINSYISMVKAEQKKLSERLETLRGLSDSLYDIALQRRDAEINGKEGPVLSALQHAQLEKLGISLTNDFVQNMKGHIISPAASIKSIGRNNRSIDEYKLENSSKFKKIKNNTPTVSQSTNSNPPSEARPYSGRGRRPGSKNKPKNLVPMKEYNFDSDDEMSTQPLSYDEKLELSQAVSMLSVQRVHAVLHIIEAREGKRANMEEFEIDFEKLSTITLRELQAYLNSATTKKPKKLMPIKNPVEVEKKKIELQKQLDNLSTSSSKVDSNRQLPSTSSNEPVSSQKMKEAGESSESSSDSSDSSSSDSSDSSDSESAAPRLDELTTRKRASNERGGSSFVKNGTMEKSPINNEAKSTMNQKNSTVSMKKEEDSSAKPKIHTNKPAPKPSQSSSGACLTILDSLLPETPTKSDATQSNNANTTDIGSKTDSGAGSGSGEDFRSLKDKVPSTSKDEDDRLEMERIKKRVAEARRLRDLETPCAIFDQMEMMANFEASF